MTTCINRLAGSSILAFTLGAWALPALALAPLEGRRINGAKVDAYAPGAVMIYDPNTDLTWLRDWNVNGAKPWVDQLAWASNLRIGTFANWSLPTARNQDGTQCSGYNCTESQMGYMWHEVLGNTTHLSNVGPFKNVQKSVFYWSGTEYWANTDLAWRFANSDGHQGVGYKSNMYAAVAVRPGDVVPVPEPQTWAMLLMGLGALTVALRRRPA